VKYDQRTSGSRRVLVEAATLIRARGPIGGAVQTILLAGSLICAICYLSFTVAHGSRPDRASAAVDPPETVAGSSLPSPLTVAAASAQSTPLPASVELITIEPQAGFVPNELNLHRGRFLLAVDNRSQLQTVSLKLDRVTGGRVDGVAQPRERPDWRTLLDLTPGQYVLSEDSHPDWRCLITVNAH